MRGGDRREGGTKEAFSEFKYFFYLSVKKNKLKNHTYIVTCSAQSWEEGLPTDFAGSLPSMARRHREPAELQPC